jgi:hypothetical protein
MSRASALAVIFFILALYAAFDSHPGTAIVFGLIGLVLAAIGSAGQSTEAIEHPEGAEQEQPEKNQPVASWQQAQLKLRPDQLWCSSSPIPRGVKVAVQFTGTYSYQVANAGTQHADGYYAWLAGTTPGQYTPHNFLYFDDHDEPEVPFHQDRALHHYRYIYTGTGTHMTVFLRRHPSSYISSYLDSSLTMTIAPLSPEDLAFFRAEQEAEEQRRLEEAAREEEAAAAERAREADERKRKAEEAAAKKQREAHELEQRRRTRLQTLEARYNKPDLAWRTDASARLRYAQEHRGDLLKRRQEIIADFEAFHRDSDFTERLRTSHAPWHARIDEIFYFEMVSIAENLPREPARDKPPPTPDERREQELSWSKVKTKDYRERAKLRLAEERDFIEELMKAFPNLTEGELQQELQRFRDEGLEMPSQRRNHDHAPGGPSGATQSRVL